MKALSKLTNFFFFTFVALTSVILKNERKPKKKKIFPLCKYELYEKKKRPCYGFHKNYVHVSINTDTKSGYNLPLYIYCKYTPTL